VIQIDSSIVILAPEPTLKVAPDLLKANQESRGRVNSLDSALLLGHPTIQKDANVHSNIPQAVRAQTLTIQLSEPEPQPISERARSATPSAGMFFRSATPTVGDFLAPPGQKQMEDKPGSIALWAIRSMRSLATMGSWAQLKGSSPPTAQEMADEMKKAESEGERHKEKKKKKDGTAKEKKKKDGTVKEKKKSKEEKDGSATVRKSLKAEKTQTPRISTSSFEIGHLSASPEVPKATVSRKHSILGLGLPSAMRLPRIRGGSTSSSLSLNTQGQSNPSTPSDAAGVLDSITPSAASNRLSVENINTGHRASVASSNGSSLRPVSVASSNSCLSIRSGTSVKWDEQGLETVRQQRRKEREERRMSEDSATSAEKAERRSSRGSRRSSEGRRRAPLSSVFPQVQHHQIGAALLNDVAEELHDTAKDVADAHPTDSDRASMISTNTTMSSMRSRRRSYGAYPILTFEEATSDGHGEPEEEEVEKDGGDHVNSTLVNRRVRPMSEQLLGRARPKAIHEEDEGVFYVCSMYYYVLTSPCARRLSILSAATNDLALLINTLDLQATPSTPDMTPPFSSIPAHRTNPNPVPAGPTLATKKPRVLYKRHSDDKSRRWLPCGHMSNLEVTIPANRVPPVPLLRFSKTRNQHLAVSLEIAPWPVLIAAVSPAKKDRPALNDPARTLSPAKMFKLGHKRTMTPAPEPEPEPSFQPLKPARTKAPPNRAAVPGPKVDPGLTVDVQSKGEGFLEPAPFSSGTFGSKSLCSSMVIEGPAPSTGGSGSLSPVFKHIRNSEVLKCASLCSAADRGNPNSSDTCRGELEDSVPIGREVRKALGRSGTLGGSDISGFDEGQLDASDPDSDVPDELKFILAAHLNRGSIMEGQNTSNTTLHLEPTSTNDNPDMVPQTHELPVIIHPITS